MREKDIFGKIIGIMFLIISITVVVLVCVDKNSKSNAIVSGNVQDYSADWIITCGEKIIETSNLPMKIDNDMNHIVMTKIISGLSGNSTAIVFYTRHQSVKVYVGEELRYEFSIEPDARFGTNPGNRYNIVELLEADNGKSVKIVLTPSYESVAGLCPQVSIGDEAECLGELIKKDALSAGGSVFLIIQGILMIFIHFIATKYLKYEMSTFLSFGGGIICIGIWALSESTIVSLVVPSSSQLSMVTFCALHLALIPMLLFWRGIFKSRYSQIFDIIMVTHLGVFAVCLICHILGYLDLSETVHFAHIMYLVMFGVVFMLGIIAKNYLQSVGKMSLISSLAIVFAGMLLDMYIYYNQYGQQGSTFTKMTLIVYTYFPIVTLLKEVTKQVMRGTQVGDYEKIAFTDALTGLGNRASFDHDIENISANSYYKYSIVNFDVNDLKITNDKYGHESGDSLIIIAARAIVDIFGQYGKCYRTGGDEFVAVLYRLDEKKFNKLAVKMKNYLDGVKLNDKVGIKVACGYAEYMYATDANLYATLKRADEKMYENKRVIKAGLEKEQEIEEVAESEIPLPKLNLKVTIDADSYAELNNSIATAPTEIPANIKEQFVDYKEDGEEI